ncbi:holin-like protein [Iodobacter fluviatilis]|uniref:Holin-like protein n=1 Tax=Iodobacter fluviatilis TaxID=537 RepID=A0A377SXI4_9NEIS|nr:holin-like protein [Iodobacter fluviatilis]STR45219.1 Holin-like protein CidA [Iodobacter fluviatilis]
MVPDKLFSFFRVLAQIGILIAIWLASDWFVRRTGLPVPGGVLGLGIVFALLLAGVPLNWVKDGAQWLLAEMLLFFVPAVVAMVKYKALFISEGWQLLVVIFLGTALVMCVTALVVDRFFKIEHQLRLAKAKKRSAS